MSFPRHRTYKGSNTAWIGEVPAHWSSKPLWTLFRRTKRTGHEGEQLLSVYRDYGVVPKASRDDNFNKPSDDLATYQLVEPGDLAINKMKAWQGSVAISEHRGIVSPAYFVFRANHQEDSRFLHYLLRSAEYTAGYLSISKGIRPNQWDLEPQEHSRMPVLLPPLPEQAAIAAFLDRETAKIDALVEEQKRLIDLLKEKRQAVVSHAVTKGLNPDAPMKDSGVEWLGEVPAHWEVTQLKRLVGATTSGPRGWSDLNTDEGAVFFQSQNIGRSMDVVLDDAKRINPIDDAESRRCRLQSDDVVICITGARTAAVAHVAHTPEPMYVNQHVCLVRPTTISGRYLSYWLSSLEGQTQLRLAMYGLKQGLGLEDVRGHTVLCPQPNEQTAIVEFLDSETSQFDELIGHAESATQLLQERRAALISAAVTGKIDVRGLVTDDARAPAAAPIRETVDA